jgi:hypothetical protein
MLFSLSLDSSWNKGSEVSISLCRTTPAPPIKLLPCAAHMLSTFQSCTRVFMKSLKASGAALSGNSPTPSKEPLAEGLLFIEAWNLSWLAWNPAQPRRHPLKQEDKKQNIKDDYTDKHTHTHTHTQDKLVCGYTGCS